MVGPLQEMCKLIRRFAPQIQATLLGPHPHACWYVYFTFHPPSCRQAVIAQLAARRSHNPKVVSSILTCRKLYAIAAAPIGVLVGAKALRVRLRASNCGFAAGVWQRGSLLAVSVFSDTGGGGYRVVGWASLVSLILTRAAVAQLVARRSHNPKVVSSILTCRSSCGCGQAGGAPELELCSCSRSLRREVCPWCTRQIHSRWRPRLAATDRRTSLRAPQPTCAGLDGTWQRLAAHLSGVLSEASQLAMTGSRGSSAAGSA